MKPRYASNQFPVPVKQDEKPVWGLYEGNRLVLDQRNCAKGYAGLVAKQNEMIAFGANPHYLKIKPIR